MGIEEATRRASDSIEAIVKDVLGGVAINHRHTITKPYGWIFFYNSRTYLETGNVLAMLAGNGPVVVLSSSGEVVMLGTARPTEAEISAFEDSRGLKDR